ncbi:MAG: histidinol-phosphate transaminase [Pseudomonadota bacterium]
MADGIRPQPGILKIALYQGGGAHLDGVDDVLKLSSNENPLGASPAAQAAAVTAAADLHLYPSTDHAALRTAIGDVWGVDPARVICGNGSGEILKLLAEAYAGPGDEIVFTEHGFSMYPIYAHSCGATPVIVAEKDRVVDVDAILSACTAKTRIVFLANPANPTGTMISMAEVTRLADGLPDHVLLALDGAYAEFVADYDAGKALVEAQQNVVMSRTFSKIYGLGGMRIGWGYGPQAVIDVLNRIRGPFNLSAVALAAAEAAVRDTDHTAYCRDENAKWRAWLADALADLGVPSDRSEANFILARFADEDEASACDAHLRKAGIIVRKVGGYGLPNALRITVGDAVGCHRVADAIAAFKGAS